MTARPPATAGRSAPGGRAGPELVSRERPGAGGVVAVGSLKGSPGVTVTALALAAAWPAPPGGSREVGVGPVVLVEADPSGGDVASWYGLGPHPGLVTWAAARPAPAALAGHWQTLQTGPAAGLAVVAAPVGVAQTRAAVAELSDSAAFASAAASGVTVVVDCGRVDPAAVPAADLLVLVTAPTPVELARLAGSAKLLAGQGSEVVVLLAGAPAWPVEQVADAVGLRVLGVLPDDPRGADALAHPAGRPGRARSRRSSLLAAGSDVAEVLAQRLALASPAAPALPPAPPPKPSGAPVRAVSAPRRRLGATPPGGYDQPAQVPARRPEAIPSAPTVLPAFDGRSGPGATVRPDTAGPRRRTSSGAWSSGPEPGRTPASRSTAARPSAQGGWVPTVAPDGEPPLRGDRQRSPQEGQP